MTEKRKSLGRWGENLAADFLAKRSYKIIAKNFRTRFGEIDLIVAPTWQLKTRYNRPNIIFVEVKTRASERHGTAEESVHQDKQDRLRKMAHAYLMIKGLADKPFAIDVVAIQLLDAKRVRLRHLKNCVGLDS